VWEETQVALPIHASDGTVWIPGVAGKDGLLRYDPEFIYASKGDAVKFTFL